MARRRVQEQPRRAGAATSLDVARLAGVSQTTVSLVLNDASRKVGLSEATQQRVREAALQLGYTPNSVARNLRRRRTNTLTFICPDLSNPYFAEVIGAAQQAAQEKGYLLDILAAQDEAAKLRAVLRMRGGVSDGVITSAPTQAIWDELKSLSRQGIACVTLQDQGQDAAIPCVGVDLEAGGHMATRHLLDCGYRRIGHVSAHQSHPLRSRERVHGYRRALLEAGLEHRPGWEIEVPNSPEGGVEAVERLLALAPPRPEALFVFNDQMAIGVLHALRRHGLRVPEDMAVVGFDGIALTAFSSPTLTTVEHPRQELGRQAAISLIERLEGVERPEPHSLLPGRLLIRESCGGLKRAGLLEGAAA
ncbi:LacI family transcriptional regulator (plasmid) [Roseomonas gilardii subsp. gilardii]|uniref:LacI family DNA-binding transcriptional regulator n=1 Tax=Roseomonas gilardii TaxID=257708 RepID=UPI001FF9EF7F|nr:LacI family DNA-binding transcriptional regulator [Roseomonas gilardii]UPG74754.1 LacI family transcriptional regulator [Roseomonas gilardii subsp. gilardii]